MVDRKKWITSEEAAVILTAKSDHAISGAYVRRLANLGKIQVNTIDKRTRLYLRSDVEAYTVKPRGTGEVRRALRGPKTPIQDAA